MKNEHERTLLIAGMGNIGSHFVAELAQSTLPVSRVVLVDPDHYEESNLVGQAIERDDLGKPKVAAQAAKLRRSRPDLEVVTHGTSLEAVPYGVYREADVVVSGLDSRRARGALNERIFRTGPARWIDGGVSPDEGLARVTVLHGAEDGPCFECDWTDADYAALEQRHLCAGKGEPPSTAASAELGSLAASGMMAALRSILVDRVPSLRREILLTLDGGNPIETRLAFHSACRFHHRLDPVPDGTLHSILDLPLETFFEQHSPQAECGIHVHGAGHWIHRIACADCGGPAERCLFPANRPRQERCLRCGSASMTPVGFESRPLLWPGDTSAELLAASVRSAGLRSGDEITFFRDRAQPEPVVRMSIKS